MIIFCQTTTQILIHKKEVVVYCFALHGLREVQIWVQVKARIGK